MQNPGAYQSVNATSFAGGNFTLCISAPAWPTTAVLFASGSSAPQVELATTDQPGQLVVDNTALTALNAAGPFNLVFSVPACVPGTTTFASVSLDQNAPQPVLVLCPTFVNPTPFFLAGYTPSNLVLFPQALGSDQGAAVVAAILATSAPPPMPQTPAAPLPGNAAGLKSVPSTRLPQQQLSQPTCLCPSAAPACAAPCPPSGVAAAIFVASQPTDTIYAASVSAACAPARLWALLANGQTILLDGTCSTSVFPRVWKLPFAGSVRSVTAASSCGACSAANIDLSGLALYRPVLTAQTPAPVAVVAPAAAPAPHFLVWRVPLAVVLGGIGATLCACAAAAWGCAAGIGRRQEAGLRKVAGFGFPPRGRTRVKKLKL